MPVSLRQRPARPVKFYKSLNRSCLSRCRSVFVRATSQRENVEVVPTPSTPPAEERTAVEPVPVECETTCSAEADFQVGQDEQTAQLDAYKAFGVAASLAVVAGCLNTQWVASHETGALIAVFILGYAGIIVEEELAFNKAGVALVMAVSLWTVRSLVGDIPEVNHELSENLAEVSEIIFFLLGAMTIVEVVDAHQGFKLITDVVNTRSKNSLMWIIGTITFFMSAVLDNLTSTIVMVSLLRKLCPDPETRRFLGAIVVIAANAGGAWTPIGDVTTTMLWINGQVSTLPTMRDLLLPSLVSLLVPMALVSQFADEVKGEFAEEDMAQDETAMAPRGKIVFGAGVAALLFVPIFKSATGLPPYLGMLAGLGAMWLLTDVIHLNEERRQLQVPRALSRIDIEGIIFFLGVLLSIGCLNASGILTSLAHFLDNNVPSKELIATIIGLASAVIDNVPLVAATMGMYDTATYPTDSLLWQLIAYCAGTGGSILIIGSAAGVAFMGMESAEFVWYMQRVSPFALAGYLAGVAVYLGEAKLDLFGKAAPTLAALPAPQIAESAPLVAQGVASSGVATGGLTVAAEGVATAALAAAPALVPVADTAAAMLQ